MPRDERFVQANEDRLLAILLQNPSRMDDVMGKISAEVFSSDIYKVIYNGMEDMARRGLPINKDNLIHLLYTKNLLGKAGEEGHIDMLSKMVVHQDNFQYVLDAVIDSFKARELLKIASQIPAHVDRVDDMSKAISAVVNQLQKVDGSNTSTGVYPLSQLSDEILDDIINRPTGIPGYSMGFTDLDKAVGGFEEGTEWIIAARPGHGKTTWSLRALLNMAKNGIPVLYISREMMKGQLIKRLYSMVSGVDHDKIRMADLNDEDKKKIDETQKWFSEIPFYIDLNFYGDEHYISSIVKKYNKLHNVKVVVLDYIQIVSQRGNDQTHELGRISREMKLLATSLGITIVVLSQLNRGVEMREDKRPMLADLRQSGNLEEDADVVVGLYRDELYYRDSDNKGKIEMIVLKQRNGPLGIFEAYFRGRTVDIIDPSGELLFNFGT